MVSAIATDSTAVNAKVEMSPIRNCILESLPLKENKIWGQVSFALAFSCGTDEPTKSRAGVDGVVATPSARLMWRARSSQSAAKRWWAIFIALRRANAWSDG